MSLIYFSIEWFKTFQLFGIANFTDDLTKTISYTALKVSKYRVFSGPHFPVFSPNTGTYGSEKTPYLDTFHAVLIHQIGPIIAKLG